MRKRNNHTMFVYDAISEAEEAVTNEPLPADAQVDETAVKAELQGLIANEVRMSETSKSLIDTTSRLSSFDVGMNYISGQLMDYAKALSEVSDSNLAIVEETTANLNMVGENAKETSTMLGNLNDDAQLLAAKTEESQGLLNHAKKLKDELVEDMNIWQTRCHSSCIWWARSMRSWTRCRRLRGRRICWRSMPRLKLHARAKWERDFPLLRMRCESLRMTRMNSSRICASLSVR